MMQGYWRYGHAKYTSAEVSHRLTGGRPVAVWSPDLGRVGGDDAGAAQWPGRGIDGRGTSGPRGADAADDGDGRPGPARTDRPAGCRGRAVGADRSAA